MTKRNLVAGAALALGLSITAFAAVAQAHGEGGYMCRTWNRAKNSPAVTDCVTWTSQAAARLKAASCDPAKMASDAMRDTCRQFMANPAPTAAG